MLIGRALSLGSDRSSPPAPPPMAAVGRLLPWVGRWVADSPRTTRPLRVDIAGVTDCSLTYSGYWITTVSIPLRRHFTCFSYTSCWPRWLLTDKNEVRCKEMRKILTFSLLICNFDVKNILNCWSKEAQKNLSTFKVENNRLSYMFIVTVKIFAWPKNFWAILGILG